MSGSVTGPNGSMSGSPQGVPGWEGPLPTVDQVAKMIDHSLLRPELTRPDIEDGLAIAIRYRTASVCLRPADVAKGVAALRGTTVLAGTVVGFPHGSTTTAAKARETAELVSLGAQEIDMVIDIGRLRGGDPGYTQDEIAAVVEAAQGRPVKVILENAYLTDQEKVAGCKAAEAAGAAFVKTSTGFAPGGATAEDITLMRRCVSAGVRVKAAGGVRTLDRLLELHRLGATRFGATATETILEDLRARLAGGSAPAVQESAAVDY